MDIKIKHLSDLITEQKVYGNKALVISQLANLSNFIPQGFLLSAEQVNKIATGQYSADDLFSLKKSFNALKFNSCSEEIIVRSSSGYEDTLSVSFAGIFCSYSNIRSYSGLLSAINKVFESAQNDNVKKYAIDHGLDINTRSNTAIIVQELVECEVTGIAYVDGNTVLVETFLGNSTQLNKGAEQPVSTVLFIADSNVAFKKEFEVGENIFIEQEVLKGIFQSTKAIYKDELCVVEFGISNGNLFIFQIRPTRDIKYGKNEISSFQHDEMKLGDKALAMEFFVKNNLFRERLAIIPKNTDVNQVSNLLNSAGFIQDDILAVRFSEKNVISLNRAFVKGTSAVKKEILLNNKSKLTTIVHDYIPVKRSFELIVDEGFWLLEHVPGLWESDNKLQPDAIYFKDDLLNIWQFNEIRLAKLQNELTTEYLAVKPSELTRMEKWADQVKIIVKTFRNNFEGRLPINIHFVEDAKGRWQFLNLRPASIFEEVVVNNAKEFVISKLEDFYKWDKASALVLSLSINRGEESKLLTLAKMLPKDRVIYVDFGVLSHPAMVLREYGCTLLPSYLLYKYSKKNQRYNNYTGFAKG